MNQKPLITRLSARPAVRTPPRPAAHKAMAAQTTLAVAPCAPACAAPGSPPRPRATFPTTCASPPQAAIPCARPATRRSPKGPTQSPGPAKSATARGAVHADAPQHLQWVMKMETGQGKVRNSSRVPQTTATGRAEKNPPPPPTPCLLARALRGRIPFERWHGGLLVVARKQSGWPSGPPLIRLTQAPPWAWEKTTALTTPPAPAAAGASNGFQTQQQPRAARPPRPGVPLPS